MSIIKMSNLEDQSDFINYFAQEELNDGISLLEVVEESFKRTILFKDVNVKGIKNEIINEIMERYFNKNQNLKEKYFKEFYDKYKDEIVEQ